MSATRKRFSTTALLHPDGELEVMGGAMKHVRAEAANTPGARAIVVSESDSAAEAVVRALTRWHKDPSEDNWNRLIRAAEKKSKDKR